MRSVWYVRLGFAFCVALSSFGCLSVGASDGVEKKTDCLSDVRDALIAGNFSGIVDCSQGDLSAKRVGFVRAGKRVFEVYDFRFRTKPKSGLVSHGGQKILVFHEGKYVGQYALSTPPFLTISIEGATVEIDVPPGVGNTLLFNEGGPPAQAWLNGDNLEFGK